MQHRGQNCGLGSYWNQSGRLGLGLGRLGGVLARIGCVLGHLWSVLEASWARLGDVLGRRKGVAGPISLFEFFCPILHPKLDLLTLKISKIDWKHRYFCFHAILTKHRFRIRF